MASDKRIGDRKDVYRKGGARGQWSSVTEPSGALDRVRSTLKESSPRLPAGGTSVPLAPARVAGDRSPGTMAPGHPHRSKAYAASGTSRMVPIVFCRPVLNPES